MSWRAEVFDCPQGFDVTAEPVASFRDDEFESAMGWAAGQNLQGEDGNPRFGVLIYDERPHQGRPAVAAGRITVWD